jgi:hypothetical protein
MGEKNGTGDRTLEERSRPAWLPEVRQYSQNDFNTVQRPEGLSGPGNDGVQVRDVVEDRVQKYSGIQISPGRTDESFGYTAAGALGPLLTAGGEVVLWEKDLGFPAATICVDNWTNQWLSFPDFRRYIPPYSGGWVFNAFKQTQRMKILLKAPSASYAPAAAIAGEFVWFGWMEAFMPPQTGVITTVKTPVVA